MAEKPQLLDVWITESNMVYRAVPYTVVTDWIQQGRLLEDDGVKPPGTKDWQRLGDQPELAAFLPRPEAFRAEDKAEALEPVEVGFAWKPHTDEDDDVDMIPLIDVSLVLLLFFMMTATVAGAGSLISTPKADHGSHLVNDPSMLWVGITRTEGGQPLYSLGIGDGGAASEDSNLSEQALLQRLDDKLHGQLVQVRIRADRLLPYKHVKRMYALLDQRRSKGVSKVYSEVSEGETP